MFLFYVFGGMGGGDVKLMGAVGALLGHRLIMPVVIYTALIGGVMAFLVLIWRGNLWRAMTGLFRRKPRDEAEEGGGEEKRPATTIPYGIAIVCGCLLTLFTNPGL